MKMQMILIYNMIKISTTICKWEIFSNEKDSYLQYFKYWECFTWNTIFQSFTIF